MNSFGMLLREYRNKSIDPETGRHLSQERLAALMGEILGTTYTSQAISDWERSKSQIHKDHRQVLYALIHTLHTCGGLTSIDDAEELLAAGNYRGLTHTEAEAIFLTSETPPTTPSSASWKEIIQDKLALQENCLTPITLVKIIVFILCWMATWLAISPTLDFSNSDSAFLLKYAIILILSGLAIPAVLAWILKLGLGTPTRLPTRFLNFHGGVLGYSLGLTNILTLALLSYNLYLYPWPTVVTLAFSLWPVVLSLISADLTQSHYHRANGGIQFRDIRFRWAILALPLLIGLGGYHLHTLLSSRISGPLTLLLISANLGGLLWSQTRENS